MITNPEIPVVFLDTLPGIHKPTSDNLEGPILKAIKERGKTVLHVGDARLVELPSLRPIRKGGSDVLWVVFEEAGESVPMHDGMWESLAKRHIFLRAIEEYIRQSREKSPRVHFYFYMGFVPTDAEIDTALTNEASP